MSDKPRKRRSTFSQVVAFNNRAQRIQASDSISPLDSNSDGIDVTPSTDSRYYRIAGSHMLEGEEPAERRGSRSSVDSGDLLDHRQSLASQNRKYGRPSFVDRWTRRRASLSRVPLIQDTSDAEEDQGPRDSFAISVDGESDSGENVHHLREDSSSIIEPSLNSKPSSRRSSVGSSLDDVCFPIDSPREVDSTTGTDIRLWPDLDVLNEFAEEEVREIQEIEVAAAGSSSTYEDDDGIKRSFSPLTSQDRSRYAVNETEVNGGRLRPHRIIPWANNHTSKNNIIERFPGVDEKAASELRFTYFREDMEATIHSPTISGLLQPNQSFSDLFPPRTQPEVMTRGSTPSAQMPSCTKERSASPPTPSSPTHHSHQHLHHLHRQHHHQQSHPSPHDNPSVTTGSAVRSDIGNSSVKKEPLIDPIAFWLDVLNPSEEEMKVISKAFGIHPLTTEDIFLGETREKVELFKNYYLVCFRSIDVNAGRRERRSKTPAASKLTGNVPNKQSEMRRRANSVMSISSDSRRRKQSHARNSELHPLNMYIIVFHEGVLTFHFAPTPHLVNVRRRARLLRDYITVSSDWISYAIIDDITDGFAPMIEAIEDEVNEMEDILLKMHSGDHSESESEEDENESNSSSSVSTSVLRENQYKFKGDMLRRIGQVRTRVMSLLRLLGNKADVIKGFAKRCNEQWEVAPRNEIGLYLGDIQDHIVTMVQSLNHYEKLLARSHSNYLALINIDMTKANNDMNDVLSKITVLGTIVLPMNIVTGLWGMNVLVPGQSVTNLNWFWGIVGLLFIFGLACAYVARKLL